MDMKKLCRPTVGNCFRVLAITTEVEVAEERQNSSQHGEPDQDQQRRFVVVREECLDLVAVKRSEASYQRVSNATSEGQCTHKFLPRILQRSCSQECRHDGERWRQYRAHNYHAKSPAAEAAKNLSGLILIQLVLNCLLATLAP